MASRYSGRAWTEIVDSGARVRAKTKVTDKPLTTARGVRTMGTVENLRQREREDHGYKQAVAIKPDYAHAYEQMGLVNLYFRR